MHQKGRLLSYDLEWSEARCNHCPRKMVDFGDA